jgi:hypothetical protein
MVKGDGIVTAEEQVKHQYPEAFSIMGVAGWGIQTPTILLTHCWHPTVRSAWKSALATVKQHRAELEVKEQGQS